jgi:hypothetical protein
MVDTVYTVLTAFWEGYFHDSAASLEKKKEKEQREAEKP